MFDRRFKEERYINPLTDFGFKRLFGTEPNKALLIDFLNVVLPERHRIEDLTYGNSETVGNTPLDRKAIFDIYCQTSGDDRFIVEIQKAKQNFFKDRTVYYTSFPIQEQGKRGDWDYKLAPVYAVGILDFVFDDHKDDPTILHTVELKNQRCEVFYDKLKFIYLELPKFTKTIDQLESHFDKWVFLLKHLPHLEERPQSFQEKIFALLFKVAEVAGFSREEQNAYENSLKYYRDLKNVIDTAVEEERALGLQRLNEAVEEAVKAERSLGLQRLDQAVEEERSLSLQRQRSLLLRLLSRQMGEIPSDLQGQINQLSAASLQVLAEVFLDFADESALREWLSQQS
jgi:predicted transposase/invertase (TIGR01784 family)